MVETRISSNKLNPMSQNGSVDDTSITGTGDRSSSHVDPVKVASGDLTATNTNTNSNNITTTTAQVKRKHHFATTSEEILKKYSNYPPSLTFHIYPTHYKFNQESIPLDSPMIKHFLHHVLREEIPVEMSELVKDFSIRSYDGCLILQVYDHRNMVAVTTKDDGPGAKSTTNGDHDTNNPARAKTMKPKTYRTLLRPTQLSLYYDLLYHTDSALTRFTDQLSIQMESEIVNLTNRDLDLSVPLNPYHQDSTMPDPNTTITWDDHTQDYKLVIPHRKETNKPSRKVHSEEIVLHKSSDYEEIMFLLSNKYKRTDDHEHKLIVNGLDDKDSNSISGQFMRLRFIEDIRKRKEAQKLTKDVTVAAAGVNTISQGPSPEKQIHPPPSNNPQLNANINPNANVNAAANAARMNNLKLQNLRAQQLQQQQQQQQQNLRRVNSPQTQPQLNNNIANPTVANANMNQNQNQNQNINMYKKQKMSPTTYSGMNQSPVNQNIPMQNVNQLNNSLSQAPNQPMNPTINQGVNNNLNRPQRMAQLQHQMSVPSSYQSPVNPSPINQSPIIQSPVVNNNNNVNPTSSNSGNLGGNNNVGGTGRNLPTAQAIRQAMAQQQQHLFNNLLSPQDQHMFKTLQQKMQTLAMMGNSGLAPNKTRLNAQQQQQAVQQAKLIQGQLVQKFPVYFQRLKQVQLRSRQMLQQLQMQQGGQTQPPSQSPNPSQGQLNNYQNQAQGGGQGSPNGGGMMNPINQMNKSMNNMNNINIGMNHSNQGNPRTMSQNQNLNINMNNMMNQMGNNANQAMNYSPDKRFRKK